MKLIKNFLYNASYQVFMLLVPLATTPYLARVFGPTGVGINSYTNSIVQYFILFGCLGTNIYANRKIAFVRDDRKKLTNTFWEIFLLRFIMLFLSLVLFIAFIYISGGQLFVFYIVQAILIIGTMLDISWFFMGIESFNVIVIKNFAVKVVTLICVFLFIKTSHDLAMYIFISSLSLILGNLSMVSNLKGIISLPKIHDLNIYQHFIPSLLLFIPEIATQIYVALNKTMLGLIVSMQSSGYYDQSDKIVKMVLAVVTATGSVMLPHVANAFAKGKYEETKNFLYDSFSIVTAISVPMFFGLASISSKLVPLFFSPRFNMVIPLMKIEAVVIVLIAWSNAIGVQYLLPTKQNKRYTTAIVLGAACNLILNIPLILILGTVGAIIATVLSEVMVSSYELFAIRHEISLRKMFVDVYKYFICGFIMYLLINVLNNHLSVTWISLVIEVLIGIVVYSMLIIIFRTNFFQVFNKIKNS